MKKIVYYMIILILCVVMTACSSDSNEHIGEVKTPSASSAMQGKNYLEVVEIFQERGFTNIQTEKIEDLIFGWLTEDGEVEEVSVDGTVDYVSNSWVSSDVEVVIKYHTFPEDEREVEQTDSEVQSDKNQESDSQNTIIEESDNIAKENNVANATETVMDDEIDCVEKSDILYTYVNIEKTMYALQGVNVRNLPSTDGEKIGGLSKAQEVSVTGQCNETGWYRIKYNGEDAYVSNSYLVADKPVTETSSAVHNSDSNTSQNAVSPSTNGDSGQSVTVPSQEETVGNLVWVPTKGGKKYHSKSGCSGMEDPMQVSIETAEANGYTPCKKCH